MHQVAWQETLNRDLITNLKDSLLDSLPNQGKRTAVQEIIKIKVESMDISKISMLTAATRTMRCKLNLWKIVIKLITAKRENTVIKMIMTQKLN